MTITLFFWFNFIARRKFARFCGGFYSQATIITKTKQNKSKNKSKTKQNNTKYS